MENSPSQTQLQDVIALFNSGRSDDAIAKSEILAEMYPDSAEIKNILGSMNAFQGQREKAVEWYTQALNLNPKYSQAYNNLGVALAELGRLDAAIANYKKALETNPNYAEALSNLGNALREQGDSDGAIECYAEALKRAPNYILAHYNLGVCLSERGQHEDAIASYTRALDIDPNYAEAHHNLGAALAELGRHGDATEHFRKALAINPQYVDALNNLGNALSALGKYDAAIENYKKALDIYPDSAEIYSNLGNALKAAGKLEDAINSYTKTVQINPDYAHTHFNIGLLQFQCGRFEDAIASYIRAVQVKPDYAEAFNNLGIALNDSGKYEDAALNFEKALEINPSYAEGYNNLGVSLTNLGRPEQAIEKLTKSIELRPDYDDAHNNMGNALAHLGRTEEAVACFAKALDIQPANADALLNLSALKKFAPDDPQIGQMLKLLNKPGLLHSDAMKLNFALGKANNDIGQYDQAFSYFVDGNRLFKESINYDIAVDRQLFSKVKETFAQRNTPQPLPSTLAGKPKHTPIFILGMPRSGTTLVEQILASHSLVYGAGELTSLGKSIGEIDWAPSNLGTDQLRQIRKNYLSDLEKLDTPEPYVTDKMPANFLWIGFILCAFPEAKIVHTRRDPRAVCWSNYRRLFTGLEQKHTYDMNDLVSYYKMYSDIMTFWHRRFPGQIYDLSYETLTEGQEHQSRILLDHLGLSWEDQCLEFHKTARVVSTSSSTQVRQKMYQGSSDEWRRYERHLGGMIEGLKQL